MRTRPGPFGVRLDGITAAMVIVLCALASVWIARDLLYGRSTPPVSTAVRANTAGARPPNRPAMPLPKEPLPLDGAATKGNPKASVALVIYSDFECPFCARFANDTWPTIQSKYVAPGKVRAAFRHVPIESIHASAVKAAEATECAGQQGQFWSMHDVLFKNAKQLGEARLQEYARELRLNTTAFNSCLQGTTAAKVRADAAAAAVLGVTGTPAFFVGLIQLDGRVKVTERIMGARPLDAFEMALDKALAVAPLAR